jgi:hypothetical protein
MSNPLSIVRLNKGLEAYQTTYQHDPTLAVSKRDASLKKVIVRFLNEQNFIYDPSKASFIRGNVFSLSSKEIDVILGVWNMLRASKKIPKHMPQRFSIEGVCSITVVKQKDKLLCIHQKNDSGCEKRGLSQRVALAVEGKQVRFFKETRTLKPGKTQEKAASNVERVDYLCRPMLAKAKFSISCSLEKKWIPINVQDLLQWRSRFSVFKTVMALETELQIIASTANYLGFLAVFGNSCGGFKMKDIQLGFSQELLMSYGKKSSKKAPEDFLNHIGTVVINLESTCSTLSSDVAKDLASLHYLFRSLLIHSPNYLALEKPIKEKVENFLSWIHDFQEVIAELDSIEADSFEQKSLQLLYDSLSGIDRYAENLEEFVDECFEKYVNLTAPTDKLSYLFRKMII